MAKHNALWDPWVEIKRTHNFFIDEFLYGPMNHLSILSLLIIVPAFLESSSAEGWIIRTLTKLNLPITPPSSILKLPLAGLAAVLLSPRDTGFGGTIEKWNIGAPSTWNGARDFFANLPECFPCISNEPSLASGCFTGSLKLLFSNRGLVCCGLE